MQTLPDFSEHQFPLGMAGFVQDLQGNIVSWSNSCARLTGIPASEMLGKSETWQIFFNAERPMVADLLLRDEHDTINREFGPALQAHLNGQAYSGFFKTDRHFQDSNVLWAHISRLYDRKGLPIGVASMFQPVDLSQFVDLSPIIRTLIEKFPLPVALVINQRTYMTNAPYAALTGHASPEDMVGKSPRDYIDDADKPRFDEINANMHSGLETGQVYRWRYRTRDNKLRHVDGRPVIFPWGTGKALISTITDVTEQVEREENLKREHARLSREYAALLEQTSRQSGVLMGKSEAMNKTILKALQLAKSDTSLIILGETGTGKSMLARVIHEASARKAAPFVVVNCAAIPEQLLESEFFGHKKGAFTNAHADKAGLLGAANGGTLFLDEVAELNPQMQAKLLHALETRQYTPVGAQSPRSVNVRLMCATNRDLNKMKEDGSLREDFFYRIFVVDLLLPPLRERKEDLPLLVDFFVNKFKVSEEAMNIPPEMLEAFSQYDWPGNVRELQNAVLRYMATGTVVLPKSPAEGDPPARRHLVNNDYFNLERAMDKLERTYLVRAIRASGGNKVNAARLLNMNLRTFHRRCARFGLQAQGYDTLRKE